MPNEPRNEGKKRPIDILRDSAGVMTVGEPGEEIVASFELRGSLHMVTGNGIYSIQLADQIDPERTNPNIPNTHQLVLRCGADSEIVARILLTATELFDPTYLAEPFDHKTALEFVFDALKDLISMQEICEAVQAREEEAREAFNPKVIEKRVLRMPSVGDFSPECKSFLQRLDHVLKSLLDIVKLFYGPESARSWFESLKEMAEEKYGLDSQFAQFMREVLPFLQFVREARNAVEHPKPNSRIDVRDFSINPKGQIVPPTIEVIHPKYAQSPIAVTAFMAQVTESALHVFELMMVFLCSLRPRALPGLEFGIVELPMDQRRQKNVRFGYLACFRNAPTTPSGAAK